MLTKLLKYDLKYMLKNMSIFYILIGIFSILTRIFFFIDNPSTFEIIMSKFCTGVIIALAFNIVFNTVIRSWVRFKDSIYKDEAYLTHTLPVTKNQIFTSRVIESLIFTIIGFAIIVVSFFIAYYSKDNMALLKLFIEKFATNFNISTTLAVLGLFFIIFLEVFNALMAGYVGIVLGYKKNDNKLLYSFVYGFIVYTVTQVMVLAGILLAGLINNEIFDLFARSVDTVPASMLIKLSIISLVIYVVDIIGLDLFGKKQLSKGVNIE